MKKETLFEAIGDIDETYVKEAHVDPKPSGSRWFRWGAMVSCLALVMTVAIFVVPKMLHGTDTPEIILPETIEELGLGQSYVYSIEGGRFSTYVGGKVISQEKVGTKIEDVSVTAGWRDNAQMIWLSQESLRGEVYSIEGISVDIAVALKFIDKGDALTTTHYYVIMNPDADLTSVEEYIIQPFSPNNMGDE